MKKIIMAMVCLMTMVTLGSCSSNNDTELNTDADIIGTWESHDGEDIYITFENGGKYVFEFLNVIIEGNFIIKDNEILWNDSHIYNATIISISENNLVLRFNSSYNDIINFRERYTC